MTSSSTRCSSRPIATSQRSRAVVGADPEPYEELGRSDRGRPGELWDDAEATYFDFDVRAGRTSGCAPAPASRRSMPGCRAPRPRRTTGSRSSARARSQSTAPAGSSRASRTDDPRFDPPATGAARCGRWSTGSCTRACAGTDTSTRRRRSVTGLLQLARREGFWEHYDPITGAGGGKEFACLTAGLILDLLAAQHWRGCASAERSSDHRPDGARRERKEVRMHRPQGLPPATAAASPLSSRSPARGGRRSRRRGPARRRLRRLPVDAAHTGHRTAEVHRRRC